MGPSPSVLGVFRGAATLVMALGLLSLFFSGATGVRLGRSRLRTASLAGQAQQEQKSKTMASLYPFYHTSDELHEKLFALQQRCPGLTVETKSDENKATTSLAGESTPGTHVDIDIAHMKTGGPGEKKMNKMFILFGEHSRELISPESGFHFISLLCGEGNSELVKQARETLKTTEFKIVLNGNPNSRRKVEQGDFCLRVNVNGVDLNRNWDEQWEAESTPLAGTNPGPRPFSEAETRIFKDLVTDYQ